MTKQMMIVMAVAAFSGLAAELGRGERIGMGIGVLVAVVGSILVVLMRNQRDLAELQYGQAPTPRYSARR